MVVENGKKVSFEYTLTVDGEVVDSSKGREPLEYEHGGGKLIPGLTSRMEGMNEGEEKKIEVPASEGYGEVVEEAFREVPRTQLPQGMEPKTGMMLQLKKDDGSAVPVKIAEVKNDAVIIDFNHPLAGKTLQFDVRIVSIS